MNKIEYGTEFLDQLKDSVHDLYDENKELKKENRFQMKLIEGMNKNNDRLQAKINKAIEYIEDTSKRVDIFKRLYCKDLLEILKGDSNE